MGPRAVRQVERVGAAIPCAATLGQILWLSVRLFVVVLAGDDHGLAVISTSAPAAAATGAAAPLAGLA